MSARAYLEECINETEAVLKLIGEAFQKEIESANPDNGSIAAGMEKLRIGVIERLRNSAEIICDEHFKLTTAACEGKGGRK
jgi:hypothetical protein